MSAVRYGARQPAPACCVCGATPTTDTRFGPRCAEHDPDREPEHDEWDEGQFALPEEGR